MATLLTPRGVISQAVTSKAFPTLIVSSLQRLPTDPVYVADIELQNVVVGSRYILVQDDDHSVVLATGLTTTINEVLSNIPAFSDPYLIRVIIRNASGSPKYKQFETKVNHKSTGASSFVIQELDE